jgi:hypothetical protein
VPAAGETLSRISSDPLAAAIVLILAFHLLCYYRMCAGIRDSPRNFLKFGLEPDSRWRMEPVEPKPAESMEDPLLKELLQTFKEDSQRVANDILHGIWVQMAIALVSLFLAVGSTVRLVGFLVFEFGGRPRPGDFFLALDITLTIVLFILSIYSLARYLILRERYSRLAALGEKLGR